MEFLEFLNQVKKAISSSLKDGERRVFLFRNNLIHSEPAFRVGDGDNFTNDKDSFFYPTQLEMPSVQPDAFYTTSSK